MTYKPLLLAIKVREPWHTYPPPMYKTEQSFSFLQSRYFREQIAKEKRMKELSQLVLGEKTTGSIVPALTRSFFFKSVQHCNSAIAFIPVLTGFFPISLVLLIDEKNKVGFCSGISCFFKNVTREAPITALGLVTANIAAQVIDRYVDKKWGKMAKSCFALLSGASAEIVNDYFRIPSPSVAPLSFPLGTLGSAFLPAGLSGHVAVAAITYLIFISSSIS